MHPKLNLHLNVYIAREWIHSAAFFIHTPSVLQQMNVLEMFGITITDIAHQAGYRDGSWIFKKTAMFQKV